MASPLMYNNSVSFNFGSFSSLSIPPQPSLLHIFVWKHTKKKFFLLLYIFKQATGKEKKKETHYEKWKDIFKRVFLPLQL